MQVKIDRKKQLLTYAISIAIALAAGGISVWINGGDFSAAGQVRPPLSPPDWLFPIVWTALFVLMGVAAAQVWLSDSPEKNDALFLYAAQLVVNVLWTVFYFSFDALLLSAFWLVFLLALAALTAVRFERVRPGAGKLLIPYLVWLLFALYLNVASWVLNR